MGARASALKTVTRTYVQYVAACEDDPALAWRRARNGSPPAPFR